LKQESEKNATNIIWLCVLIILVLCVSFLSYQTFSFQRKIKSWLIDNSVIDVKVENLKTNWLWLPPYYTINNVAIKINVDDNVKIGKLDLKFKLLQSLFKRKAIIDKIYLHDVVIERNFQDDEKSLSIDNLPLSILSSLHDTINSIYITDCKLVSTNNKNIPFTIDYAEFNLYNQRDKKFISANIYLFEPEVTVLDLKLESDNKFENIVLTANIPEVELEPFLAAYGFKNIKSRANLAYTLARHHNQWQKGKLNFNLFNIEINDLKVSSIYGSSLIDTNSIHTDLKGYNVDVVTEYFDEPITVDKLKMSFNSSFNKIESEDIQLTIGDDNIDLSLNANKESPDWRLIIEGKLPLSKVADIKKYYPKKLIKDDLRAWLGKSLLAGDVNKVAFKIDTLLNDEPINYQLDMDFANLAINVLDNWPKINKGAGSIHLDNDGLSVKSVKAKFADLSIDDLELKIDFTESDFLRVKGVSKAPFVNIIHTLQATPYKNKLHHLNDVVINGDAITNLNLDFNLTTGNVSFLTIVNAIDASIYSEELDIILSHIKGDFIISDEKIYAENIDLNISGTAAKANFLYPNNDGYLVANFTGKFDVEDIELPTILDENLTGQAQYQAKAIVSLENSNIFNVELSSDLKGIQSNLPVPLNKQQDIAIPSRVILQIEPDVKKWLIKIDNLLLANIENSINSDNTKGIIQFVKDDYIPQNLPSGLNIIGNVNNIALDEWLKINFISDSSKNILNEINLQVDLLDIGGYKFNNTNLKYINKDKIINFNGDDIKGSVAVKSNAAVADFAFVNLINNISIDNLNMTQSSSINKYIIKVDKLKLMQNYFYDIDLTTKQINNNMIVDKLNFRGDGFKLMSSGKVINKLFNLSGTIDTKNLGHTMATLGYPRVVKSGSGILEFNLNWPVNLAKFSSEKVKGNITVDLTNGNFLNVDPGIGRVVGLLNLDNIKKRLKLDFSDLVDKGMNFDSLTATIDIDKNYASSNLAIIEAPIAHITLEGNANLSSHELDIKMAVFPKVGGTLPVAAAIATANPAVGAALWLIDKASGSKFRLVTQYYYQISGTWDKPKITEIVSKAEVTDKTKSNPALTENINSNNK